MDKAIANALVRHSELRREMDEIDAFLAMYRRFGGETDTEHAVMPQRVEADDRAVDEPVVGLKASSAGVGEPRRSRRASPEEIANAAIRTITDIGKPLSRADLASALTDRGIDLQTKDPANYIGTIMWRHAKDRVISLDGLGYWPSDRAYGPAGYEPGTTSANFLKAASDLAEASSVADESHPDDERDAQIERQTDEAVAAQEKQDEAGRIEQTPPSAPPRPRPAREAGGDAGDFLAHIFRGGVPPRRT